MSKTNVVTWDCDVRTFFYSRSGCRHPIDYQITVTATGRQDAEDAAIANVREMQPNGVNTYCREAIKRATVIK